MFPVFKDRLSERFIYFVINGYILMILLLMNIDQTYWHYFFLYISFSGKASSRRKEVLRVGRSYNKQNIWRRPTSLVGKSNSTMSQKEA